MPERGRGPHEGDPACLGVTAGGVPASDRSLWASSRTRRAIQADREDWTDADAEVARYASLLLTGTYAAEYLRIGLVED